MRGGIADVQTSREKQIQKKILHSLKGLGSPDQNNGKYLRGKGK
jgi:hypothetical protein